MTAALATRPDLKKLSHFFEINAPTCIHDPDGKLKYRFITPSYAVNAGADDKSSVSDRSLTGHYLQMYDWDSCFFSQAGPRLGAKDLPHSVVANFLSLKESDGYVPRTVSPSRIWDAGDICKPFLSQTLVHGQASGTPGAEFIQDLECYYGYFQRHRLHKSGLYHWRNVLESGVDDNLALLAPTEAAKDQNVAVGDFPDGRLLAVDLNSYLAAEYRAMSTICAHAGATEQSAHYKSLADELVKKIDQAFWNDELGIYCNLDPDTHEQVVFRAWTGLTPLLMGVALPERVERVVKDNVMNESHFLRPAGLSSVAGSETLYNNACRGLYGRVKVSNWQGPMWVLPNALAVRALRREGLEKQAREIALRVLKTLADSLAETGTLFENYHAETGKPLFAPQFMSWNILALELIELLES
jgi:hypothetical protein